MFLPPQTELTRSYARQLAHDIPRISLSLPEDVEAAKIALPKADAAFGTLPPDLLPYAHRLRWLHSRQIAPPPGYYYPDLVRHPVVVTNSRGVFNDHIGAHVLAFVLALARDLPFYHLQQTQGAWTKKPLNSDVVSMADAEALIVGVGEIGAETGRLLSAFGTRVVGVDARRTDLPDGFAAILPTDALSTALATADFVILTIPHTPATEGLIDATRFAQMKQGAFFINIGRGATTRLDDLVAALSSGHLRGAGLDVTEIEPLPPEHPLWRMDNVLITPHMAGFGPHLDARRYEIVRQNCQALLEGMPLRNVVDKARWF